MEYHVFRKPKKLKDGKTVHRWYYYYLDVNKKQIQKACKGCKSRKEAENYIRTLPDADIKDNVVLIKDIADTMYLPGGEHIKRRIQLGKIDDPHTLDEARKYIKLIVEKWGHLTLAEVDPTDVTKYLFTVNRSGSWKNRYTSIFGEIFIESQWYGCKLAKPQFQRFAKNTKKADIFTTSELSKLFILDNFPTYEFYLFFLLCLSAGLRLGEIRAVRPKQILFDRKAMIVDGFCKRDGRRTSYNKKGSPDNPRLRVILLPDFTLAKIADHITKNSIMPDDFCFTVDGQPVRQSYAEYIFETALVKAGIAMSRSAFKKSDAYKPEQRIIKSNIMPDGRKLVVHSLRYTYVTRMRRELPAETVMKMVGHTSVDMTDYYTQKRALDEALDSLTGANSAADNLFL
jgi:integrase